jgi:hypothetical protein
MAFNNAGHFWLANGESLWVTLRFFPHGNNGSDNGVQWIMASPLSEPFAGFEGTTQLESGRFQKRVQGSNTGTDWSYNCLVENSYSPGWNATFFDVSGGGNA